MNDQTIKDIYRAFEALGVVEGTLVHCLFCKHCAAIYKSYKVPTELSVKCELYSAPMREFECFEKDPLINIE